jgi:hypothetical protein
MIRENFINDDNVRKLCVDNKCDEIFIASLTAFPQSSIVQSHCLRALAALVFGNDTVCFDIYIMYIALYAWQN